MKSIIFICPYFGKLPESHMPLWLQSCKMNPDITWWIITDDKTEYEWPGNIKITYMTLEDFRERAEDKFGRKMELTVPYKLCDYKPVYGYIFEEEIENYDFWGHCDLSDTIFGNLRSFLTDEVFKKNDKILFLGHMTLYRNTKEINRRFMLKIKSGMDIWDILNNRENMIFDEISAYSINAIYMEYGFPMIRLDEMYVDIEPNYFRFIKAVYNNSLVKAPNDILRRILYWKEGRLFDCRLESGAIIQKEIGYVHFQKRKMKNETSRANKGFYIVPNKFLDYEEEISIKFLKKYSRSKLLYLPFFRNKASALRYRITHIKKGF